MQSYTKDTKEAQRTRRRVLCVCVVIFVHLCIVRVRAQEKIPVYPSTQKVTIDGFEADKEPPFLDHYKPGTDSANGSAILVCPGGAYTTLALKHEGSDVAAFYTHRGFDVFVLHYRVNNFEQQGHRHPDQYNDVTTAMRLIKARSKEWKLDADRIGILGFSAGGHLASMCATMHVMANKKSKEPAAQFSSRPAFAILIYPVIVLAGKPAHNYSRQMLLGKNPDDGLVDSLSTNRRVDQHTPPVFLVYANDDDGVPPENGMLFYKALRENNVPASILIYDHGGHGFGLGPGDPVLSTWPELSVGWLRRLGF